MHAVVGVEEDVVPEDGETENQGRAGSWADVRNETGPLWCAVRAPELVTVETVVCREVENAVDLDHLGRPDEARRVGTPAVRDVDVGDELHDLIGLQGRTERQERKAHRGRPACPTRPPVADTNE